MRFVIFKIDSQTRVKEPVLKITDFSEARGKELAPGEYQLVSQLAAGVPEDEVLESGLSGGRRGRSLKSENQPRNFIRR
jgi:hypothetical protein